MVSVSGRLSDFAGAWSDMGPAELRGMRRAREQRRRLDATRARRVLRRGA